MYMRKTFFVFMVILFSFAGSSALADSVSEKRTFYVDSSYDLNARDEVGAVLVRVTPKLYFYVDQDWWNFAPQNKVYEYLTELDQEFENNIYPNLTSVFGSEENPGIDKDSRITVLIHPMANSAGGYFRSNDEYLKVQVPDSNQREMLYLNSEYITTDLAKSFLAHEFVHLITFNQKDNTYGLTEDTWLNEARAEYAPTYLGYDDAEDSNLQRRTKAFKENPSDSIIGWSETSADYASLNLFTQYLVDHYGVKILEDSLKSDKTGLDSLNYALEVNGFTESPEDIFFDWTIAVLINDCTYGDKYCYLNPILKDFHVSSKINFLPVSGESSLSYADFTREWAGNWYKIIGGNNDLEISFKCRSGVNFRLPYITQVSTGSYKINFLSLGSNCSGKFTVNNFGKDITALYLIPSAASPSSEGGSFYPFSWTVSISKNQDDTVLIQKLLDQIAYLQTEIAKIQAQIASILGAKTACGQITSNLIIGMSGQAVSCLQQFLKTQGSDIYPEGLVTGYFGSLTRAAVIRFQEKYSFEILSPFGLTSGTGYVGSSTREKINNLLTF
jgi:peptidoglycan hydrolase-like protein with peptidoglycan-binding domain